MKFTVFRHASYDTPWWATSSSTPGRFNQPGQGIIQYWSLHPLGPAAEMLRHNVGPEVDPNEVSLHLWTATVDVDDDKVTWIDFKDCQTYGITVDELVGEDYRPTQALAVAVRKSGATAMVAPSAALPGTHNLMLFGARVLHPYLWKPLTDIEIPTGHLTNGAHPPAEVTAVVRWKGATHEAAEEWKATGTYTLLQDPHAPP
jgi:hypothetical protein